MIFTQSRFCQLKSLSAGTKSSMQQIFCPKLPFSSSEGHKSGRLASRQLPPLRLSRRRAATGAD